MSARAYATVLAVIALAVAGAFLLSEQGSPYTDATDASGTDDSGNIRWNLSEGVLTLSLEDGHTDTVMTNYEDPEDVPWLEYSDEIVGGVVERGITNIGSMAFAGCYALASVDIQGNVGSIGYGAFAGCAALASVTFNGDATSIGGHAFENCSFLASVDIQGSVGSIGYGAFAGCAALASVDIQGSVGSIGYGAFAGCAALASVNLNVVASSIGESAFKKCYALSSEDNT
ncbi:MAG: leucine-rich repeat domain-containing protein, partial [Candidatus Methanoplasma sp.]|nr:leucine-rich repeat domain-containing protein [Candidatus Methanoplasma sp.]